MNADRTPRPKPPGAPEHIAVNQAVAVVGVDGSATSWDALCWACGEARRADRRLVAVYVTTSADAHLAASAPFAGMPVAYAMANEADSDVAERLKAETESYAQGYGVDMTFAHAQGEPVHELLEMAHLYRADLLIVGKSIKARHHLAGSLGRRLAGKDNTPIIVIVP